MYFTEKFFLLWFLLLGLCTTVFSQTAPPQLIHEYKVWFKNSKVGDVKNWAGGSLHRTETGARHIDSLGIMTWFPKDNPDFNLIAKRNPNLVKEWSKKNVVQEVPKTISAISSKKENNISTNAPIEDCVQPVNLTRAHNSALTGAEIVMPMIPIIKYDARSVELYNKKQDKIILAPEEEATFHECFLMELHSATKQTKPSENDFKKMINTLSQGATREGIYHAIVLDSVYNRLESVRGDIKAPASEFAIYFYRTYIAKIIQTASFKTMTMYTLKRLVVEKALEMVDAFGENRDDLETWYAILSSDLATRYPQLWTNSLRKNTSKVVHKNWASRVPVQYIKSEIMIKMHMIFNLWI